MYYSRGFSFNKITNIQGKYFTLTGKNIDSELIYAFADSLTDLYEADAYEYEFMLTYNKNKKLFSVYFLSSVKF